MFSLITWDVLRVRRAVDVVCGVAVGRSIELRAHDARPLGTGAGLCACDGPAHVHASHACNTPRINMQLRWRRAKLKYVYFYNIGITGMKLVWVCTACNSMSWHSERLSSTTSLFIYNKGVVDSPNKGASVSYYQVELTSSCKARLALKPSVVALSSSSCLCFIFASCLLQLNVFSIFPFLLVFILDGVGLINSHECINRGNCRIKKLRGCNHPWILFHKFREIFFYYYRQYVGISTKNTVPYSTGNSGQCCVVDD